MNHIATGRALSPDEELLPPHHGDDGGEDLAVDVDDEHTGGGWSQPEAIPTAFPPSVLLPAVAFCLSFVYF